MSMYSYLIVLSEAIFIFTANAVYGQNCPALQDEPWSYQGDNGPASWDSTYPDCNGKEQSPIEINSFNIDDSLGGLDFTNYDQPISNANVKNTGYTIKVTPNDGISRTMSVDGKEYSLREFVFHWGDTPDKGAEHLRLSHKYPMEMQLVHTTENNETTIVAVYFQDGKETANEELQKLVDVLPDVQYKDDESDLSSNFKLDNFFQTNTTDYWLYNGSLTTPPCTEGVKWFVIVDESSVGTNQMNQFRQLYAVKKEDAEDGCRLVNNIRPPQPRNGRFIFSPPFVPGSG